MIVPRTPLLVWFAALALPLATLAAILPGTMTVCVAGIGLLAALAAADAWGSRALLRDIRVELPAVARLQKDCDGVITGAIQRAGGKPRSLRVGLPFPRQIGDAGGGVATLLPAGAERVGIAWPCHPLERGQYPLTQYFLETPSRLGLWAIRRARETKCELRVYPNFLDERKHIAALFLNRGRLGIHAQRQVGKGRDFEKLREYIPGDSYDEIHWKASAKRGRPVTKVFQAERTQEVYVVLDASRLMARESALFERYITAGLLLGVAAEQQGDSFGMIAFSDRVLHFARARSGKAQFNVCRDMLHTLQPQGVTPDFDELASFIRTRLRKRALLVFLTALDDPALSESFLHAMDLICRQHLILVNMLRPAAAQPVFSDSRVSTTDDLYGKLGGHLLWHDLRELGTVLHRRGVRFTLLEKEMLTASLVSQYVNVKAMQLI
jgi:uncharacterized protein (DUF58 family)